MSAVFGARALQSEALLKIGLVFDDSLDKTDGVAQYVLILGQWLADQGHDVHYLVGQTKRTDLPNLNSLSRNMRVRFNHNRMTMPLPASKKKIRQLLEREQFDVLHVQVPYSPALAGRIISAASSNTAVIGTFHILPHSRFVYAGSRLAGLVQRVGLRRFDAMMSTSPPTAEFARGAFRIESTVVPIGIPLKRFAEAKPFAKYKKTSTIVFLGRLVQRKGCQHLLAAIQKLKQHGQLPDNTKVVVCGSGPLGDQLKQFVRNADLEKFVSFEGFVSEEDKPKYFASADIVIYPSTGGESFGIVLIEAMAATRGAVIVGNNPGYASVMGADSQALFDPHDHDALADKIHSLLNDKKARHKAYDWQKEHVRQFDINVTGPQVLNVYKQALRKKS